MSAVYDLTGEGRVAVRASYGRYTGGSSGASANPGQNAADVNPNAIITRTYSNWDGRIPYVPIAANLTSTSGGGANRSIDQDIKGPYVDEYTAGLDLGLSRLVTVQFNYVRKIDGNGFYSTNLALPYDAYTVSRTGVDPGPDNTAGTTDDQTLTVFSVPNTYPTFGQNIERVVQADGDNRYHAMGATLNKQFANNYSFLIGFDADYRDLRDTAARNPNEALYGPGTATGNNYGVQNFQLGQPSWNYAFRMSGTYMLPCGLLVLVVLHVAERRLFLPRSADPRRQQHAAGDPHQSAGRPLLVDEDLGQPHHQEVQDVGEPVDPIGPRRSWDRSRHPVRASKCRRPAGRFRTYRHAGKSCNQSARCKSTICGVRLACKSSATAIGRPGFSLRMRLSNSPSPSSLSSVTMAPCRSSKAASQPLSTASRMALVIFSKASRCTGPLGEALPATGVATEAPRFSAMSR